jgi:hypothetical protein
MSIIAHCHPYGQWFSGVSGTHENPRRITANRTDGLQAQKLPRRRDSQKPAGKNKTAVNNPVFLGD